MKLLLATNNINKQKELQDILKYNGLDNVQLLKPNDLLNEEIFIEENGSTLQENSYIKASTFYSLTKINSIADDSGLFIDALGGEPGVNSAIYAGEHGNDAKNRQKVLRLLKNVPLAERTAHFKTVICYIENGIPHYFEGVCSGIITTEERGVNGFGYDPIFIPDGYTKTFAEMLPEEKNRISHRFKAIEKFIVFLKSRVKQ